MGQSGIGGLRWNGQLLQRREATDELQPLGSDAGVVEVQDP